LYVEAIVSATGLPWRLTRRLTALAAWGPAV
jgi:hypothetical protein